MIKQLYEEYKKALSNQNNLKEEFLAEAQLSEKDLSNCAFVNGELVGLRKSWSETIDNFSNEAKEKAKSWWTTIDSLNKLEDKLCQLLGDRVYRVSEDSFIVVNHDEYGESIEEREELEECQS